MTTQLPGPMFSARPGWGGQLREWLHENLYVVVFRLLLLIAAGLVIASIVGRRSAPVAVLPSPTATPDTTHDSYYQVALAGEGMTHLAAKAVNEYSNDQIPPLQLDAIQHLFAVDALARNAGWHRLALGDGVTFRTSVVADVIFLAKSLSPAQRSAWARFLK